MVPSAQQIAFTPCSLSRRPPAFLRSAVTICRRWDEAHRDSVSAQDSAPCPVHRQDTAAQKKPVIQVCAYLETGLLAEDVSGFLSTPGQRPHFVAPLHTNDADLFQTAKA